jgi:large conductance mechanosensitive channel
MYNKNMNKTKKIKSVKPISHMKGFLEFIRSQGVVGLAIGFIMGGSITRMVTSFVNDIINPIVGILISRAGDLKSNYFSVGSAKIMWGSFISNFIDFVIIAFIIYLSVKILGLDKLDKKK